MNGIIIMYVLDGLSKLIEYPPYFFLWDLFPFTFYLIYQILKGTSLAKLHYDVHSNISLVYFVVKIL